jgi:FkbM family methyltransferase
MTGIIKRIINAARVLGMTGFLRICLVRLEIAILKKSEKKSYSQLFEDYFLDKFVNFKEKGFYIDIGANDPDNLNNTKRFYSKGWRGINVEPNFDLYKSFLTKRPGDINLNLGIGNVAGTVDFYNFYDNVYSTFSKEEADKRIKKGYKILDVRKIEIAQLKDVIMRHLPKDIKIIDFMSIDTEGLDLICLKTNDWEKFRPKLICVETTSFGKSEVNKDDYINNFLESKKYKEIFFNGINSIYADMFKIN